MKTIVGRIPCAHSPHCNYQVPLVECESPDGPVCLEVDRLAVRIHHRYAHSEEIDL